MKEMTTEELLKEIEEKHNNSLFEEIFKRRDKELYRTALFYKNLNNLLKYFQILVLIITFYTYYNLQSNNMQVKLQKKNNKQSELVNRK